MKCSIIDARCDRLLRGSGPLAVLGVLFAAPFAHAVGTDPLNDTGITGCGNALHNNLTCTSLTSFPAQQDASFGRDVDALDNNDGVAGFSFTKIAADGTALAANATEWHCVLDNVTGLMWEVKTNDGGMHDKDWQYSWYQSDKAINGGNAGKKNGGSCHNTKDCDTLRFTAAVNAENFCGHADWRMPTREELLGIVYFNSINPAIDTDYFPNTVNASYWTATPNVDNTAGAWLVRFGKGGDAWDAKIDPHYLRLVRNAQ